MENPSDEVLDLESTLERALGSASPELNRTAAALGTDSVALLLAEGTRVEVIYISSLSGATIRTESGRLQALPGLVKTASHCLEAQTPLAQLLRDSVLPDSQSFLLFPWQLRRRIVTAIFGFASAVPPISQIPNSLSTTLNAIALAVWSVKEIANLRAHLKTANERLASRKLVERAKGVIQAELGVHEEQAYEYLRGLSRRRRITLAQLAEEVLTGRARNGANSSSISCP